MEVSAWRLFRLSLLTFLQTLMFCDGQTGGTITYHLPEEGDVGDIFGSIITDANLDTRYSSEVLSTLRFRFLTEATIAVSIGYDSGFLATNGRIDRESIPGCRRAEMCRVTLDVAVQPSSYFQIIKVIIEIEDVNDNAPQFDQTVFEHGMKESTSAGSMFVVPSAMDQDSPKFGIQTYRLRPENEQDDQLFALRVIPNADGSKRVKLQLVRRLDREVTSQYRMALEAIDGGKPPQTASLEIIIEVLDSNDHHPVFTNSTYDIIIPEDIEAETTIIKVQAIDHDIGKNGKIEYMFSPSTMMDFGDLFSINPDSGEIFTIGLLDHEQEDLYNLIVTAQDKGPDSQPMDANVVIHVEDVNDNAPVIIVNTLTASGTNRAEIPEDSPVGSFVAHLTVTDADTGLNGDFGCKLNDNAFTLQRTEYRTEYQILTTVIMDREKMSSYSLALHCDDFGMPPLRTTQHIHVEVTDINDHVPTFSQNSYTDTIIENNYLGARVLQVNATDADTGLNAEIVYTLSDNVQEVFDIEQGTGTIFAKTAIDREETSQYRFYVMATDRGTPPLSASVSIIVIVEDVNDEGPRFTDSSFTFTVDENESLGTLVGTVKAQDLDAEPYNAFFFSFIQGSSSTNTFMIDSKSGKILTRRNLDRESQPVYHLVIAAKDANAPTRFSSTASVTIYVNDLNDNSPGFLYPTPFNNTVYMSNKVPIGYNLTRIRASDPDNGPNGRVTYDIQSGNADDLFSIDPDTGILSTNEVFTHTDYKLSRLQVLATDHGTPSQRSSFADLVIVVNKSIAYLPPGTAHYGLLSSQNLLIVISVACGCAVVVVILIVAIVCIRRQDKIHRAQRYNCRMEAIGRLTAKEQNHDTDKVKDQSIPLPVPEKDGTLPKVKDTYYAEAKVKDTYYAETMKERIATPSPKVTKKLYPHELPAPAHRGELHIDALSIHSNEGSNTDSGRGASEEGDQRAARLAAEDPEHKYVVAVAPGRSTHSSLGQYSTPGAPGVYYPHLKAHAAAHSYSSHPPTKLRSFAPEDEDGGRAQAGKGYEAVSGDETPQHTYPRPARVLPAHGNGGYATRAEMRNNIANMASNPPTRTIEDHNANNTRGAGNTHTRTGSKSVTV